MGSIAASMKALAKKTQFSPQDVKELFQKGKEGDRLAAIEVVHGNSESACFDLILEAIQNSKSAYEQWRALVVAQDMLPLLNKEQNHRLAEAIKQQRSGAPGTRMAGKDQSRYVLGGRILQALGQS